MQTKTYGFDALEDDDDDDDDDEEEEEEEEEDEGFDPEAGRVKYESSTRILLSVRTILCSGGSFLLLAREGAEADGSSGAFRFRVSTSGKKEKATQRSKHKRVNDTTNRDGNELLSFSLLSALEPI